MRISEFKKVLKSHLFNPQSAIRNPKFLRYFSLSQQHILFVLAILSLSLLYFNFYHRSPLPPEETLKETVVEVQGEIPKPGIYIFEHPPTLKVAIEKAGGLKAPGLLDQDSFSEPLRTGTLLNIRKESQQEVRIKVERMQAHKLLLFNIPLDLNQVSAQDLCLIPGIGESLAHEIIVYRERRKGFRSVEELKNVTGIGDKKLEILKPFLTVSPR